MLNLICSEVLICGVCDSGKTTLISGLVANKRVETYTSMIENKLEFITQLQAHQSGRYSWI